VARAKCGLSVSSIVWPSVNDWRFASVERCDRWCAMSRLARSHREHALKEHVASTSWPARVRRVASRTMS